MQLLDGTNVYAATDLVGFLACEHLTGLEVARLAGLVERPFRDDPELKIIQQRGFQHEARYLEQLQESGRSISKIELDGSIADRGEQLRDAAAETERALRAGADVVYQATFFDGRWRGHADFLLRVERPSRLGAWSYEVADTKLARHVKGSAILQICSYIEGLVRIQGVEPEQLHVVLGGRARETASFRVSDFMAYYRLAKRLFEAHVADTVPANPPAGTYPEPAEHCDVCRWDEVCTKRRRADDHLSLVAGITSRQRRALTERSVDTRTGLAGLALPLVPKLEGVNAKGLERVQRQAAIQVRDTTPGGGRLWEVVEPSRLRDGTLEPDRGLLALPEPRPGDLFFDIEGDPYASDEGIDYLFGVLEPGVTVTEPDGGTLPAFHAIWSRDADGALTEAAERDAFERLMDLFTDRLTKDPSIHIYHYAPYEPTALRRLMGRYGTREDEVDGLLRAGTLVDLYHVVRQGVRASVESYSIKRLEKLYGFTREVDLRDAGSSIAAFEAWLQGAEGEHGEEALARIQSYNRDDVVSTLMLRDWLEATVRPRLAETLGQDVPRKAPREPEAPVELAAELEAVATLAERLAPNGEDRQEDPEAHARWLLAQLLWWHRREEKSFWHRWYVLKDEMTDQDRLEAPEPISGLRFEHEVGPDKRSVVYRYSFPEQEYAVKPGGGVRASDGHNPGEVVDLDEAARTVDLKHTAVDDPSAVTCLIPFDYVDAGVLHKSILRTGEWVADHGIDGPGPHRAARDLLMRRLPRAGQADGAPIRAEADDAVEAAVAAALALDDSYLAIQGPPGSGKTYIGARIAIALAARGLRVGVTANSHKVIGHLLGEIADVADREVHRRPRIGQRTDNGNHVTFDGATPLKSPDAVHEALVGREVDVVGGTGWLWSRPEFAGLLDVLIIDEAGQMSLANAVASSQAASSVILLGDPQQLDQPVKGSHPPGAERSALAHLLDGTSTMPPERGIFLERTRRLHPAICAFTSEAFYEGRLEPIEHLDRQVLVAPGAADLAGSGVRLVLVPHAGNANDSPEEAQAIAGVVRALTGGDWGWVDAKGLPHDLGLEDVLVVTPYNAQVGVLEAALPAGARIGTVDKFQGQEAPVSIYSMATSTQDDAPRGMEFLYSLNRLNVATSRARCVALVVASPELLRVRAKTPRQMQLANALARFAEHAALTRPGGG
jgi:uncharacterized protein